MNLIMIQKLTRDRLGEKYMSNISVSSVKELRQRTGLGMMDCKKALDETNGDLDKAEDLLRLKSGNKASKLSKQRCSRRMCFNKYK